MQGKLRMHLSRRCGARTRSGTECKSPAMPNGRCRMHGGTSPGAPKGNRNAWKHGHYSAEVKSVPQAYPPTIVRRNRTRGAVLGLARRSTHPDPKVEVEAHHYHGKLHWKMGWVISDQSTIRFCRIASWLRAFLSLRPW